jgi:hypothetical protein
MTDATVIHGHRTPTTVQRRDGGGLPVRQGGRFVLFDARNSTHSLRLSAMNPSWGSWHGSRRRTQQLTKSGQLTRGAK